MPGSECPSRSFPMYDHMMIPSARLDRNAGSVRSHKCGKDAAGESEPPSTTLTSTFFFQRPDNELDVRRFAIAPFKLGQENRPLLLRSSFPHDLASAQRLTLARWFTGGAIRQQIVGGKWP